MDLHGPVTKGVPVAFLFVGVSAVSLWHCCSEALTASALVVVAAAAAAAPAAPPAAAAAPPAVAFAAAASSVSAAATPHAGLRACPAVCTVAAPLLQLMCAGRAP